MSNLTGIAAVMQSLKKLEKKFGTDPKPEIVIGFAQDYAIYVHENLETHHPVGNAKYLEIPLRQFKAAASNHTMQLMKQGKTLTQAMLMSATIIKREAQDQTPVDTGALKASAYVCQSKNLAETVARALAKAQQIRETVTGQKSLAAMKKGIKH